MSVREPNWKPARSGSRGNLPVCSLLPYPAKVKRSLRRTMLIYWRMMSHPPAIPHSCAVHHPRTPCKPTREKGHLADPTDPSVLQDVECKGNPAGINDRHHQLTNMCMTGLGASPTGAIHVSALWNGPRAANDCSLNHLGTPGHALHSPWTAYPRLLSSPRLVYTALRHVRWFFRPRTITCCITTRQ